jgi:myo-inositol-1(or 4)-monophosphatase
LNAWDLAAGAAMVLAAGGHITALEGGPVDLHVGQILASNGLIHQALQRVIVSEST